MVQNCYCWTWNANLMIQSLSLSSPCEKKNHRLTSKNYPTKSCLSTLSKPWKLSWCGHPLSTIPQQGVGCRNNNPLCREPRAVEGCFCTALSTSQTEYSLLTEEFYLSNFGSFSFIIASIHFRQSNLYYRTVIQTYTSDVNCASSFLYDWALAVPQLVNSCAYPYSKTGDLKWSFFWCTISLLMKTATVCIRASCLQCFRWFFPFLSHPQVCL